jgi:hypothetical protein
LRQVRGFVNAEREAIDLTLATAGDGFPEHDDDASEGPGNLEVVPRSEDGRAGTCDGIGDDPSLSPVGSGKSAGACDAARSSGTVHREDNVAPRQESLGDVTESLLAST